MKAKTVIIALVCLLFAVLRFTPPAHTVAYQALAHVWVGGLFGAWWTSERSILWYGREQKRSRDATYLVFAVVLTVVEIVAFSLHLFA